MKNQSNQNNQSNPKNTPAKPARGKAEKVHSASGKPAQPGATASTAEKDIPKPSEKLAQKKPEDAVEKKPPSATAKPPSATSAKEKPPSATAKPANAAKVEEKKPPSTTEKPPSATAKPADAGRMEEKKGSGASLWIGSVALLFAILAGLGVYHLYLQGQQQSTALAKRLGELQSSIDANQSSIAANQQQLTRLSELDTLKQEISAVRSDVDGAASVHQRIEAEQQALNTRMTEMASTLGRTTLAWRLAEVEYLLIVANTRLTLERDPRTALVALQTADQKLRAIGDPAFVPVRQSIANEITTLKAVAEPDITGMALTLASLSEAAESLPVRDAQPARASGPALTSGQGDYQSMDWSAIPSAVWKDIRGLVVVRRMDKPIEPLQPPSEEWYLRENLQLKLEQARLSLLRHETTLFQHLLDEASHWLKAHFDEESAAVKGMLKSLQELKQADLQPDLPDISESLRILRKHMQSLGAEVEPAQREGGEQ